MIERCRRPLDEQGPRPTVSKVVETHGMLEIAARVQSGRAHIYPTWGHLRTCTSSTTASPTLGFFLAVSGTR
jgi:hypothetical protein